ncbi:MAG: hypothetical protein AAF193_10095 [Bacteroidota bacterium]
MKILKVMGVVCAALFLTLASCKKEDVDIKSNNPIFDCPELEANIEDPCEIYEGNNLIEGYVNADCDCVSGQGNEPDCPDFYFEGWSDGNFGSPCETNEVPIGGVIGENCECVEGEGFCPELMAFPGGSCYVNVNGVTLTGVVSEDCDCLVNEPGFCSDVQGANANYSTGFVGDFCMTTSNEAGVISDNCECVPSDDFCPEFEDFVGGQCNVFVNGQTVYGVINQDCDCEINEPGFCDELQNANDNYPNGFIGQTCYTANDEQGVISDNCECVPVEFCDEVTNLASWYPLEFPNGVELAPGDPCWNSNDEQSTVNDSCECQ